MFFTWKLLQINPLRACHSVGLPDGVLVVQAPGSAGVCQAAGAATEAAQKTSRPEPVTPDSLVSLGRVCILGAGYDRRFLVPSTVLYLHDLLII